VFAISLALGRAHLILLRHLHRSCQLLFADIHIQTISEEILSSSVNAIHGRTSVEARYKKMPTELVPVVNTGMTEKPC